MDPWEVYEIISAYRNGTPVAELLERTQWSRSQLYKCLRGRTIVSTIALSILELEQSGKTDFTIDEIKHWIFEMAAKHYYKGENN